MSKTRIKDSKVERVIYGGGGIRFMGHLGAQLALQERQSTDDLHYTGLSAGAIIAAFIANRFGVEEIIEAIDTQFHNLHPSKVRWKLTTVFDLVLGYGLFDLQSLFRRLVDQYGLKPQDNLRIVAYNLLARRPVYFQGCNYDLAAAIAASCAVPVVMRPVWLGGEGVISKALDATQGLLGQTDKGLLMDGAIHHPIPAPRAKDKDKVTLISKLGFASRLPSGWLHPLDLVFHLSELAAGPLLRWYFPDPVAAKNIIVETAPPDIACLSFGIPRHERNRIIDYGYDVTRKALVQACRKGLVGPLKT